MNEEAQAAQTALPIEAADEVVGQADALERRSQHELAWVEDERPLLADIDQLRQVVLRFLDVDERVARVVEDAEVAVDADVDARRLEERGVVGIDRDAALVEQPLDGAVRENHEREFTLRPCELQLWCGR